MMWVIWLSTLYIHVIHTIYPRYMIVYTVGHMLWTKSIYDVGNNCGRYAVDNTSYDVGIYCGRHAVDNTSHDDVGDLTTCS
jgi:hypothetical protein